MLNLYIKKKKSAKILRILSPISILFSINCTSLADTPSTTDTSGIDSIKGNIDTATSSANTAKETGNTVKEFIPKGIDNPDGKSSPNSPPPNSPPQLNLVGYLIEFLEEFAQCK